jgi:hypothetical protein
MVNFRKQLVVLMTLLALSGNATADTNLWLGVKAGTLGVGLEGIWRPIEWVDLRVGGSVYDYEESGGQAGIDYDATLALQTYYATANFRFPLSPFRITAGIFSNSNEIKMASIDSPTINVGGTSYTATEVGTLTSTTSWDSTSPYLGAGFDFELLGKVGLTFDFGVLWQGDPKVSLNSDGSLSGVQSFLDDLETERSELEDEVDILKAYPVLALGFNFNF